MSHTWCTPRKHKHTLAQYILHFRFAIPLTHHRWFVADSEPTIDKSCMLHRIRSYQGGWSKPRLLTDCFQAKHIIYLLLLWYPTMCDPHIFIIIHLYTEQCNEIEKYYVCHVSCFIQFSFQLYFGGICADFRRSQVKYTVKSNKI